MVPSGKRIHDYSLNHRAIGTLTISSGPFSIAVLVLLVIAKGKWLEIVWLVVWNILFFHILGIIIPIDEL